MQKSRLVLEFSSGQCPELISTTFSHSLLPTTIQCVRGKSAGAFDGCGSFQWTKAVKALSTILLLSVERQLTETSKSSAAIAGHRGSLAASLDYALDKQPLWLIDMFGIDSRGTAIVKRLLRRSNPGRKRAGPATLALNEVFFSPHCIEVVWDDSSKCSIADLQEIIRTISREDALELFAARASQANPDKIREFGSVHELKQAA